MRICFLQYDLVGLYSIYESGCYFKNSSQPRPSSDKHLVCLVQIVSVGLSIMTLGILHDCLVGPEFHLDILLLTSFCPLSC